MMPDQHIDDEPVRPAAEPVRFAQYEAVVSQIDSQWIIRRHDPDHARTVCFVETLAEWDRFVTALLDGASEVDAVHAIDDH